MYPIENETSYLKQMFDQFLFCFKYIFLGNFITNINSC